MQLQQQLLVELLSECPFEGRKTNASCFSSPPFGLSGSAAPYSGADWSVEREVKHEMSKDRIYAQEHAS